MLTTETPTYCPVPRNFSKRFEVSSINECSVLFLLQVPVFLNTKIDTVILRIYLVMEYVKEGSLTKYINERGRLDAVVYRKIFCQLTKVVSFLMEQEIYHR